MVTLWIHCFRHMNYANFFTISFQNSLQVSLGVNNTSDNSSYTFATSSSLLDHGTFTEPKQAFGNSHVLLIDLPQ